MPRRKAVIIPREHHDPGYERKRNWYLQHRDEIIAKVRQTCLAGRFRNLHKRPYTEICEVCGSYVKPEHKQIEYHHWDDANPSLGVWCCSKCHKAMSRIERGQPDPIRERYWALKAELTGRLETRELVAA